MPINAHIHRRLRTKLSRVAFMCCPFSVSIMKRVSAKAYRDSCGCLWEESPVILLTGVTARTVCCGYMQFSRASSWPFFKWNPPLLSGAFEDTSFASLAGMVSDHTLKAVKEMGFEHMTEIQHKSIRPLLEGR